MVLRTYSCYYDFVHYVGSLRNKRRELCGRAYVLGANEFETHRPKIYHGHFCIQLVDIIKVLPQTMLLPSGLLPAMGRRSERNSAAWHEMNAALAVLLVMNASTVMLPPVDKSSTHLSSVQYEY